MVSGTGEKYGVHFLNFNFIETEIYVNRSLSESIRKAKRYLVFTSAKAVEGYLKNYDQTAMYSVQKNIFCLGGETLKAAEMICNASVKATAKDAASLADEIIKCNITDAVSFICGKSRREELPEMLKKNNISVEEIEIYQTCAAGKNIKENYAAVMFFSPSGAESFFQSNILKTDITCFCIGETTASSVNLHTYNQIIVAEEPTQQSMLNSIITHYSLQEKIIK